MSIPTVHVVQILIRHSVNNRVCFLVHPHESWRPGQNFDWKYLVMPAKKSVADPYAPSLRGQTLEEFVKNAMEGDLKLSEQEYALEDEISPTMVKMPAVKQQRVKEFVICPVVVWVDPAARQRIKENLNGQWLTCEQAAEHKQTSPTARAVFKHLLKREEELAARYRAKPEEEEREENPHRLLVSVPDRPSMYALARRWFSQNRSGVRYLSKQTIDEVLDSGKRAFNLRVADPYLRYQLQGVGFTWSFFTEKDKQDVHVHSAPTVEIYGVLEGEMEIWWKPYYDRGTSAWSRQILSAGDWIEVEALQCHIVNWTKPGKGVVFKAGPGPMAEIGRLGVKGKTPCDTCPCVKPPEMLAGRPQ